MEGEDGIFVRLDDGGDGHTRRSSRVFEPVTSTSSSLSLSRFLRFFLDAMSSLTAWPTESAESALFSSRSRIWSGITRDLLREDSNLTRARAPLLLRAARRTLRLERRWIF